MLLRSLFKIKLALHDSLSATSDSCGTSQSIVRLVEEDYPLGKDMFLALTTNRGIVQPTFYDGIVSAITPATKNTETRLLQISTTAIGGISGGVVCDPTSGAVLGMVTSGLVSAGQSLPITYAIPSEVLQPYADAISFGVKGEEVWR